MDCSFRTYTLTFAVTPICFANGNDVSRELMLDLFLLELRNHVTTTICVRVIEFQVRCVQLTPSVTVRYEVVVGDVQQQQRQPSTSTTNDVYVVEPLPTTPLDLSLTATSYTSTSTHNRDKSSMPVTPTSELVFFGFRGCSDMCNTVNQSTVEGQRKTNKQLRLKAEAASRRTERSANTGSRSATSGIGVVVGLKRRPTSLKIANLAKRAIEVAREEDEEEEAMVVASISEDTQQSLSPPPLSSPSSVLYPPSSPIYDPQE